MSTEAQRHAKLAVLGNTLSVKSDVRRQACKEFTGQVGLGPSRKAQRGCELRPIFDLGQWSPWEIHTVTAKSCGPLISSSHCYYRTSLLSASWESQAPYRGNATGRAAEADRALCARGLLPGLEELESKIGRWGTWGGAGTVSHEGLGFPT